MDFRKRGKGFEIMDDFNLSGNIMDQTLKEIDHINNWIGGKRYNLNILEKAVQSKSSFTIMDLGCGSGDLLKSFCKRMRRVGKKGKYIGVDANPYIIEYARKNCADYDEIEFLCENVLDPNFRTKGTDIVNCCLFLHHFKNHQILKLLGKIKSDSNTVIINDLHRHPIAFHAIDVLTRMLSRSEMVKHDAKLSVARAFKKEDFSMFFETLSRPYKIRWKWAFRWIVVY